MQKPKQLANRAKKWLANSARFFVLLAPLLLLASPAHAVEWGDIGMLALNVAGGGLVLQLALDVINLVVGGILVAIYSLAQSFVNASLIEGGQRVLLDSEAIRNAWEITLSATNALLVLALAVMAVLIITGLQNYNLKKAATSLIYAIIVANLSYEVVHILVDLGEALRQGIVAGFSSFGASANPAKEWLDGMNLMVNPFTTDWWSKLTLNPADAILRTFVSIATLAIGAYVMVKLALILLERAIRLALAIVLAPLIFVIQLFPGVGLDKLAQNWWSDVIKWVLVYPGVYLLLSLAGLITAGKTLNIADSFTQVIDGGSSVFADLILAVAALVLTIAAGTVPALLQLKSIGDGFFKPVDKSLGALGKLSFGGIMKFGAESRDKAAEGKFGKWVPTSIQPLLTKTAKFGRSVDTGIAALQRQAKEIKDFPAKRNDKLLGELDERKLFEFRGDLRTKSAEKMGITVEQFDELPIKQQEETMKDVLKKDHVLSDKIKYHNKNSREVLAKKAKDNIEDGMTPQQVYEDLLKAARDIDNHYSGIAKLSDTDRFDKEKKAAELQETLKLMGKESGFVGYQSRRYMNEYLANTNPDTGNSYRTLPNRLTGHLPFVDAAPGQGEVDEDTLIQYGQLAVEKAQAKADLEKTISTLGTGPAVTTLATSLKVASSDVIESVGLGTSADTALEKYVKEYSRTRGAKITKVKRIIQKQSSASKDIAEDVDRIHKTMGRTSKANVAEKTSAIREALTRKLQPVGTDEIAYVENISDVLTNGNLNINQLPSAEAVYTARRDAGAAGIATAQIAKDALGYATVREEEEKVSSSIAKAFSKSENYHAVGQKVTASLQRTAPAGTPVPTFDTRKAEVDTIIRSALNNPIIKPDDIHKSVVDIVTAAGASAPDVKKVVDHYEDIFREGGLGIIQKHVPLAQNHTDAARLVTVNDAVKINRKTD